MKMKTIFSLVALLSTVSSTSLAADSVKETAKETLMCNESETGSEVQLQVETIYTTISFNKSGSMSGATKRTITLSVRNETAKSIIAAPAIPADISWEDGSKFDFLKDDYLAADGTEYRYESTFHDKKNKQYPAELLRLRALVPVSERVTEGGMTVNGYSINLIMPEGRLKRDGFSASGYLDYSIEQNKTAEFTIGLAAFKCTEKYEHLGAAK